MPTETRGASKRRKVAQGPLLGDGDVPVPSVVVDHILCYLDLRSLVRISGCNSALRKQVFKRNNNNATIVSSDDPWRSIDFGNVPTTVTECITDRQLAALLRNCHAKDRCQFLRLTGCVQIRGSGLEPLRDSCWLREADLRLGPNPRNYHQNSHTRSVDPNIVLPILSSMPPMAQQDALPLPENSGSLGLSLVKFQHQRSAGDLPTNLYQFEQRVGDWLVNFHEALGRKATQHETKCGYCHDIIMSMSDDEAHQNYISYCELCRKYTHKEGSSCGGGDCPSTSACSFCLLQCCQTDVWPRNGEWCPNPRNRINKCTSCSSNVCHDCNEPGFYCGYTECRNYYCNKDGCNDNCIFCQECWCKYCPECYVAAAEDDSLLSHEHNW